jgi:hypothetical protein
MPNFLFLPTKNLTEYNFFICGCSTRRSCSTWPVRHRYYMGRRSTKVKQHFKPSIGSVVPSHERLIPVKDVVSASGRGPASPKTLLGKSPVFVFPAPEHVPSRPSLWQRLRPSVRTYTIPSKYIENEHTKYWASRKIQKDGSGEIHLKESYVDNRFVSQKYKLRFGPGCFIYEEKFGLFSDWSNANMPDSKIFLTEMCDINFAGANLRNAKIGRSYAQMENVSLDGADLEGAVFDNTQMFNVSLRGANVKGTVFNLSNNSTRVCSMDFRDSNISAEQYDQIVKAGPWSSKTEILINKYCLDDIAAVTGDDKETLGMMVWVGELELRNKADDSPATDTQYDEELHYVPQWAMQDYVNSQANHTP